MTRAEKVVLIRATLAEHPGWTQAQAATAIGMKRTTLSNLLSDPDGAKQAERRKRYQGTCEACGKPTGGWNGYASPPRYCNHHFSGSPENLANTTLWTRELLLTRIREWTAQYGEPPAMRDWNPNAARAVADEARAIRFETGDWPWFTLVVLRFGTWNAAIAAAGFEPRIVGGGNGNCRRRRNVAA